MTMHKSDALSVIVLYQLPLEKPYKLYSAVLHRDMQLTDTEAQELLELLVTAPALSDTLSALLARLQDVYLPYTSNCTSQSIEVPLPQDKHGLDDQASHEGSDAPGIATGVTEREVSVVDSLFLLTLKTRHRRRRRRRHRRRRRLPNVVEHCQ